MGTQYRSAIFYHDEAQREVVEQMIDKLDAAHVWKSPIVTEVTPLTTFYIAEDYHQEYYVNNTGQPYCRAVIAPKLSKLQQHFVARLKTEVE